MRVRLHQMMFEDMVRLRRLAARKDLMPKLSENQEASLTALRKVTTDSGVHCASKAAWKKACPAGVSVHAEAMVKTGTVMACKAAVSTNGKIVELYNPVEFTADPQT